MPTPLCAARLALLLALVAAGCSGSSGDPTPAAAPTFTPPAGPVADGTAVTLASATAGASFLSCTGAGCTPEAPGATVVVHPPAVVRAQAIADGHAASAIAEAAYTLAAASTNPMGLNNTWVETWDPSQPFADLCKGARRLTLPGSDAAVPLDAMGDPTGDFNMGIQEGAPHNAAGTYRLRFRGQATVDCQLCPGGCGDCRVTNVAFAGGVTTADVELSGTGAVGLSFRDTDRAGWSGGAASARGDGLAAISLARPGLDLTTTVLNPVYSGALPVRATRLLRTMGFVPWGDPSIDWTDRPRPGSCGWGGNYDPATRGGVILGVAWEYLVLLANEVGKDVWITPPLRATDDYLVKVAQTFAFGSDGATGLPYTGPAGSATARPAPATFDPYHPDPALRTYPPLRPDLKLYVEHGNENWNFGNDNYRWNAMDARYERAPDWAPSTAYASGAQPWDQQHVYRGGHVYRCITAGTSAASGGPSGTGADIVDGTVHWAHVGARSSFDPLRLGAGDNPWPTRIGALAVRTSLLFRSVFGDARMMSQVRPIYASQADWLAIWDEGRSYLLNLPSAGSIRSNDRQGGTVFTVDPSKPVSWYVWGYSGAPYVEYGSGPSGTVDQAFGSLYADFEQNWKPRIDHLAQAAREDGVKTSWYEAGSGQGGFAPEVRADPRMRQLTMDVAHYAGASGQGANADVFDVYVYTCLVHSNLGISFTDLSDAAFADNQLWFAFRDLAAGL